jgi:hypothetical protein
VSPPPAYRGSGFRLCLGCARPRFVRRHHLNEELRNKWIHPDPARDTSHNGSMFSTASQSQSPGVLISRVQCKDSFALGASVFCETHCSRQPCDVARCLDLPHGLSHNRKKILIIFLTAAPGRSTTIPRIAAVAPYTPGLGCHLVSVQLGQSAAGIGCRV